MGEVDTFDKILQVQEYKSQISRLVVEDIFGKLHISVQKWVEYFHGNVRKRRRADRFSRWHRLELFGSAAVGTSTDTSDLDVNLIVPPLFIAEEFFSGFPKFLEHSGFTNIFTVENASVPLVCFTYKNMEVDLCFTVVSAEKCPTIVDIMRFSKEHYANKRGFLATQGLRVAYILKHCFLSNMSEIDEKIHYNRPKISDSADFYRLSASCRKILQQCIMFVKSWAQNRGIYGNVFCYPGGISWTIMLIYCFLVCKRLHCIPLENWTGTLSRDQISRIIRKFLSYFFVFFDVYFDVTKRHLPLHPRIHIYDAHNIDIMQVFTEVDARNVLESARSLRKTFCLGECYSDKDADLKYGSKELNLMHETFHCLFSNINSATSKSGESSCLGTGDPPGILEVLNPAPSYTNSVYNVTISSIRAIHYEFHRAVAILSKESLKSKCWSTLIQPIDVFNNAETYIIVELECPKKSMQKILKTFESQIKHFLYHLECNSPDCHFRLFPKSLEESIPGFDQKRSYSMFSTLNGKTSENEHAAYCRYAVAVQLPKNERSIDIHLDASTQFLHYAFERSEEDIRFQSRIFSDQELRSFYTL